MAPAADRRVRRTRTLLHQALIGLILEKGYGRITVQDILDRADMGRSTFYSHYHDKDALLLDSGLDHLKTMIADAAAGTPGTAGPAPLLHPALVIFRLADGNRRLYQALIGGRGSELVARTARAMLSEVFADHLRSRLPARDGPQLDITVAFLVSGLMGLLTWWLDNKVPLTAEQMYDRFEELAAHGIKPLLPQHPQGCTTPPQGRAKNYSHDITPPGDATAAVSHPDPASFGKPAKDYKTPSQLTQHAVA